MPAHTRGKTRRILTFVQINAVFCYGWRTKDLAAASGISEADLKAQLGHMTAAEAAVIPNRVMVTGANSPKPARYKYRATTATTTQTAATSTYAAFDKGVAATNAGWVIVSNGRSVVLRPQVTGQRSVTAVAELSNGVLYAYPMNLDDFQLVEADLGLESAAQINATEAPRLCTGSRTKPGKMQIQDGGGILSTYYSTASYDTAVQAGYSPVSSEFLEFPAAAVTP